MRLFRAVNTRSVLILLLLGLAIFPARAQLVITNNLLAVNFNPATGLFAVTNLASSRTFISQGNFNETSGTATMTPVTSSVFGQGQEIQFVHADGNSDCILLYSNLPFALFQSTLTNASASTVVSNRIHTLKVLIDLNEPWNNLKILGTGGLSTADKKPGSYAWLAIADPQTRNGVVGAWLTSDRGSGAVFGNTNSIYSTLPQMDAQIDYGRLQFLPGQTNALEIFALGYFDDARVGLESWANAVAQNYNIKLHPQPDGLCTYPMNLNGGASSPAAVAQLTDFVKTNLEQFGFNMIQFDAGWQAGITSTNGSNHGPTRVFTQVKATGAYSAGVKPTADYMWTNGITPGIWFEPFAGTSDDPYFTNHEDWFAKTTNGTPYWAEWGGNCFDMTYQPARDYVSNMVSNISHNWDYLYFKMDGFWTGSATPLKYVNSGYSADSMGDAVFSNPAKPNIEAFRDGIKLVRQAAGTNIFFDGCNIAQNMRSYSGSFGLLDAMRVGPDNSASWSGWQRSPQYGSRHYFLQGRIWYNDPDTAYVRDGTFTLAEAQTIGSWYGISGQLMLDGDWIPGLSAERLNILKRILPHHGLMPRPVDYFETDPPNIWLLTQSATNNAPQRDVVGIFNWDSNATLNVSVTLAHLGLATNVNYVGFDFWSNSIIPNISGSLQITVQPGACDIIAVRPQSGVPELISTSRHVTQGIVDVLAENWDGANTLSGTSKVVENDPYELRIYSTNNWQLQSASVSADDVAAGVTISSMTQTNGLARITLNSPTNREVNWSVVFSQLPTVTLTSPTTGQTFYTNDTILLSASASDSSGTITKVDFYDGTTNIGTVTSEPYNLSVSNFDVGAYNFSAIATDNNGITATSSVAQVQVQLLIPFTISATPASTTVSPGVTTNFSVTVATTNSYSGNVAFSLSGLPSQASANFSPTSVNGFGSSTLTVTASNSISSGTYNLTIYAISGGLTNSTTVALVVNGTANLEWNPISSAWDTNAANWLNLGSGLSDIFQNGDNVLFDDSGSAFLKVTIAAGVAVAPSNLVVNADVNDYTISGAGKITGATGIEKDGADTLTISTTNDFTGPVNINYGTLALNAVPVGTETISVANAATFQLNANYNKGITLTGSGTWNVNADNNSGTAVSYSTSENVSAFTGTVNVLFGTRYWLSTQNSMPAGMMYVASGGQLGISYNGLLTGNLHIAGAVWGGSTENDGALRLNSGNNSGGTFAGTVTLDDDAGIAAGQTGGTGTVSANISGAHALTIVNGTITLSGNNNFGALNVPSGSTVVAGSATAFGGGGLAVAGTADVNGFNLSVGNLSGSGTVANYGAARAILTVGTDNTSTTFSGPLVNGSAGMGFIKTGSGALTFSGVASYGGTTTVSNGTLVVNGAITGGAVNVASAGTLGGNGGIANNTTVDGALAPGTNSIGTLSFGNNLTLNGGSTTQMKLNKLLVTNDVVKVTGTLTYGGTLTLTNLTGTLATNDQFKLFNAGNYSGAFTNIVPAIPGINLAWNTNNLSSGILNVVALPTAPPKIAAMKMNANNFIFSGSNGVPNWPYYILTSTNLGLPLANWTMISTNAFDANGNFIFTNPVNPNAVQSFYLLKLQ